MFGHPERSLPRFLRQTQSKDLHLFFVELQTHYTSLVLLYLPLRIQPSCVAWAKLAAVRYLNSANCVRNFFVARKSVFLAVSSVVLNISPIVRSLNPW
jgi:hypothetical protein